MRFRATFLAVLLVLGLCRPGRAETIDITTEILGDGWLKYTYTIEDPTYHGLQSFVVQSDYLQELREVSQPIEWMHYTLDDRLTWARDVMTPDEDRMGELLTFSFESRAMPDVIRYRIGGTCFVLRGDILGPGPEQVPIVTTTTPEPTSLSLLAMGGLGMWFLRRSRREPA